MRLSKPLGQEAANEEVNQALKDLKIRYDDNRPSSFLAAWAPQANLSGLLGPSITGTSSTVTCPLASSPNGSTDQCRESRIESYR